MARVIWSPQALDDVDAIASYLERNSQTYAKLQVQRFFDKVKLLETHPLLGRVVPEVNQLHFRELIVDGTYRIVYRVVDAETLGIVTVHHTSKLLTPSKLGLELDPLHFLIQETFSISTRPLFVIGGKLSHGTIKSGMLVKHKDRDFEIKTIEMLDVNRSEGLAMVAFIIEVRNEAEKALLKEIFEKGEIIEIF